MPRPARPDPVARGRSAAEALAVLGDHLEHESARIDREAFAAIEKHEMDSQLALDLWVRKNALYRFIGDCERMIRAGERSAPRDLDIEADLLPGRRLPIPV